LSTEVYAEIEQVLACPKFAASLPADRRQAILELLAAGALWFAPTFRVSDCSDPADNKYLELTYAAGATVIVSSDRHLLEMHPWRGVVILWAAEYLARVVG
jgi:putative PIN family toxin of toxin-antitoxin system